METSGIRYMLEYCRTVDRVTPAPGCPGAIRISGPVRHVLYRRVGPIA